MLNNKQDKDASFRSTDHESEGWFDWHFVTLVGGLVVAVVSAMAMAAAQENERAAPMPLSRVASNLNGIELGSTISPPPAPEFVYVVVGSEDEANMMEWNIHSDRAATPGYSTWPEVVVVIAEAPENDGTLRAAVKAHAILAQASGITVRAIDTRGDSSVEWNVFEEARGR